MIFSRSLAAARIVLVHGHKTSLQKVKSFSLLLVFSVINIANEFITNFRNSVLWEGRKTDLGSVCIVNPRL